MSKTDGSNKDAPPKDPVGPAKQIPLVLGIIIWTLAALVVTAGLFVLVAYVYGKWAWPDKAVDPDWIRVVTLTTLPTAGVLAGAAAVAVTIRRQRTAEDNLRLTFEQFHHVRDEATAATERTNNLVEREQLSGKRDRFVSAAKQMAETGRPVQLAGTYSLVALIDDWLGESQRSEAQTCIRLLCAFAKSSDDPLIRRAIFDVVADRLRQEPSPWQGFTYDLSGIVFTSDDHIHLNDVILCPGTVLFFDHAVIEGANINFLNARLKGGRIDFTGAELKSGRLKFGGAWFESGELSFKWARFGSKMRVALRPRYLKRGVVTLVKSRGQIPTVVVPPSEEEIAAKRAKRHARAGAIT